MSKRFLFIDGENVFPKSLEGLPDDFCVEFFIRKRHFNSMASLLSVTPNPPWKISWTQVKATGKNALDFQLVFELGRLVDRHPDAEFFILSKDRGFDAASQFLNRTGASCRRIGDIDALIRNPSKKKPTNQKPNPQQKEKAPAPQAKRGVSAEKYDLAVSWLKSDKNCVPKRESKLISWLCHRSQQAPITVSEAAELVFALRRNGIISGEKTALSYHL